MAMINADSRKNHRDIVLVVVVTFHACHAEMLGTHPIETATGIGHC
jgi:hypothetical protein